jgi:hypothetical protein
MEELIAAFDVQFPECGDTGEVEYRRIFDEDVNCDQVRLLPKPQTKLLWN